MQLNLTVKLWPRCLRQESVKTDEADDDDEFVLGF